jgi:hypothetical protein
MTETTKNYFLNSVKKSHTHFLHLEQFKSGKIHAILHLTWGNLAFSIFPDLEGI